MGGGQSYLVTKHKVSVRHGGGHLVTEELDQKGRGQIHRKDFALLDRVLGDLEMSEKGVLVRLGLLVNCWC